MSDLFHPASGLAHPAATEAHPDESLAHPEGEDPETPRTLVVDTFFAAGTWTSPAQLWHADNTENAAQVELWAPGAGGTTATGGGGGGEYRRSKVTVTPSTGYAIAGLAGAAANANATDATFATTTVVAKGGQRGADGGAGGTGGTGDAGNAGGNGTLGAGSVAGGGGAGSSTAASGGTAGEPQGGFGQAAVRGRLLGAAGGSDGTGQQVGARGEARITYEVPATAGYPRVRGRSIVRDTANATSRAATLPSGIVAGELLLLVVASDGVPTITESGGDWTPLAQVSELGSSQVALRAFYKVASGSDSATIATSASEKTAHWSARIADSAGTAEWSTSQGSSTNADPPSHPAAGGSAKQLCLAVGAWDGSSGLFDITAAPSGYGNVLAVYAHGTTNDGVQLAVCERFAETDTENPGAWGSATEQWCAATILVPPA